MRKSPRELGLFMSTLLKMKSINRTGTLTHVQCTYIVTVYGDPRRLQAKEARQNVCQHGHKLLQFEPLPFVQPRIAERSYLQDVLI